MTTFYCPSCKKNFYNSRPGANVHKEKITCPHCGKKIIPKVRKKK